MDVQGWQQVDRIFQAALECEPGERRAFLEKACSDDNNLRRKVEALLSSDEQGWDLLEKPVFEAAADLLAEDQPGLFEGEQVGHYKVLGLLGTGGMGEVYLAEDNRLGRKIALKVLPATFVEHKDRLKRFQQEARAASALNHPNIVTIHEIGQFEGRHFIATEFIEGETLRQKIKRGKLNVGETLDIAIQMASALVAAHGAGIVHRDIKPENIMLRTDGYVKVLDFGLAKLIEQHETTGETEEQGEGQANVSSGLLMGTVRYMSPEQASGAAVDARSDIFSFGVVLFELLAGRTPSEGETARHLIVAELEKEPPRLSQLCPDIPESLEQIVDKTLRRAKAARYQTATSLLADLRKSHQEFASNLEQLETPLAVKDIRSRPRKETRIWTISGACLLALLSSIAFWEARRRHPQAAPLNSIAVLPFINESRDSDTEYLSDGMTETITRDLSKIPNLRVISRSSAFRYREKEINPQSIGRELNVQAVLIGRIQKSGERLSLSTELINVEDNSQIWSEQYNRRITDALALQEEIPITIARRLQVKLSGADRARLNIRDTADVEAYRHYMKGRYFWDKRSAEGMRKAQEHFEQAIAIDPNYALAYAGLADCFALTDASPSPHSEGYAKAKSAAIQALALDETLAEAHTSLAWIKFNYEWDWGSAENEFNRAIELNPNYATAHHWYSVYLSYMGRYDEAITEIKKAQELDPLSLIVNTNVGVILSLARRYDEAIEELTKVLEMDPNFIRARLRLGLTYPYKKMYEEAIAQIQNGLSIANDEPSLLAALGSVYARSGQRSRAKQILQQVKQMQGRDGFRAMALANIYRDLGETEQALMYLQEAYEAHDTSLFEIKGEEVWDSLRSDPRFIDLLRRVEAGGVGSQQLGQGLK